jgi:hypothetical protein
MFKKSHNDRRSTSALFSTAVQYHDWGENKSELERKIAAARPDDKV